MNALKLTALAGALALALGTGAMAQTGGAAGAGGCGRATGARFGRVPAERPLGRGEVTTTRGSCVGSFGCAVSAELGPAASSATGSRVNDDDVMMRIRRMRLRLRPSITDSIPAPQTANLPVTATFRSVLPFAPGSLRRHLILRRNTPSDAGRV